MVFHDRSVYPIWNDCCESVNIACVLRYGVASVGIFSIGHGSPYRGKDFGCRKYTGGQSSCEVTIAKKVGYNCEESRIVACKIFL